MNKTFITFCILLFTFTGIYASEKTIYAYLGETFTISPWGDRNISTYDMWWTCVNTSLVALEENKDAFGITEKKRIITHTSKGDGFYCEYNVTPFKKGVYYLRGYHRCYKLHDTYGYEYITYTVVVSEAPKVISINGIPSNITLNIGKTYSFKPVIVEEGAKTTLTWNSSNTTVATVNNGVVTAHNPGTSIITCTASNGVYTQCLVTVNPNYVTGISLNYTEKEMNVNDALQLYATIVPENATNSNLEWNTSNANVAMVTTTGMVIARSKGWAEITATTTDGSNLSAGCTVHVVVPPVLATSLTFETEQMEMTIDEKATLVATLQPSDISSSELIWSSSDNSIATVDNSGTITAVSIGNVIITAHTTDGSNLSASCNVRIKSPSIDNYDNTVYFNDTILPANCDATLSLQLKNNTEITAVQFDLLLPEAMKLKQNNTGTAYNITFEEKRADVTTHTISSAPQNDGSIRVLCYSTSNEPFLDNKGTILYFPVSLLGIENGNHNIILKNIIITNRDGSKSNIKILSSTIRIVESIPGDANMDNEVDVADIVAIANHILSNNQEKFSTEAADYDNDGIIDVADIVNVANHILGANIKKVHSSYHHASPIETKKIDYSLEILPFTLAYKDSKNITLDLINPNAEFTAFQCDIHLPTGLTIDLNRRGTAYNLSFNAEYERTDANYHTLSSAMQENGAVRVLCYSTANEIFLGEDGALLNIPVTADEEMISGIYEFIIDNAILTYSDGEKVKLNAYKGSIILDDAGNVNEIKLYGKYTANTMSDFSAALKTNYNITSIDLSEAKSIAGEGTLTTGNPNTIIYLPEKTTISNTYNVVCNNICNNLILSDEYPFAEKTSFVASHATLQRELIKPDGYATIVLPFAPSTENHIFYALASENDNELIFEEVTEPIANTPYLYKLRNDNSDTYITGTDVFIETCDATYTLDEWSITGSFFNEIIDCSSSAEKKYFIYNSDTHKLHKVTNTLIKKPFRAYLTTPSPIELVKIRTNGQHETSLDILNSEVCTENNYYDLTGRKVTNPQNGIFINNGKKIIINR